MLHNRMPRWTVLPLVVKWLINVGQLNAVTLRYKPRTDLVDRHIVQEVVA